MVFFSGPREVGKTSLARSMLPSPKCELNYDIASQREAILRRRLPAGDFWFFDEIHKFRGWRDFLKGLFDEHGRSKRILVTGSARLDLYRYGGDFLQGRYFHLRLHPFSVAEPGGHADALPTVARWTDILKRVYSIFRLAPFGAPKLRAVKKERKHYHYDWSIVPDAGARFENLVASHLLKWVEFQIDTEGRPLELRYFRDVSGREVDFVITDRMRPIALVECKSSDDAVAPALKYLKARFPEAAAWQVSASGLRDYLSAEGIRVAPATVLLGQLV